MANVKNTVGPLFENEFYTVIKKHVDEGQVIAKHDHPQYYGLVTLLSGSVMVDLDNEAPFPLSPGDVLEFDGELNIGFKGLDGGADFTVTLVSKNKKPL